MSPSPTYCVGCIKRARLALINAGIVGESLRQRDKNGYVRTYPSVPKRTDTDNTLRVVRCPVDVNAFPGCLNAVIVSARSSSQAAMTSLIKVVAPVPGVHDLLKRRRKRIASGGALRHTLELNLERIGAIDCHIDSDIPNAGVVLCVRRGKERLRSGAVERVIEEHA